ncbi:hypothetical protein Barb7_00143 [Bacteroidales bacterium Barb7]|nr:hypothetical protein Barb7_00143 [Bacteroidales bacterium Barb7]
MEKLKVPYLPQLDRLDLPSAGSAMEHKALRKYINTVNWEAYPYKPVAVFDIARTDTNLYIRFFVRGSSLKALHLADGSPVFTDSCVEFFMKKDGDTKYMNFEFNCIGTCDASRRQSRNDKQSLTPEEYAAVRRHSSLTKKAMEEQNGIYAWELTVAIPFTVMGLDPQHLPEKITGNFYKCADDTETPHYLSWNPVHTPHPDFHRPEFFGDIYL